MYQIGQEYISTPRYGSLTSFFRHLQNRIVHNMYIKILAEYKNVQSSHRVPDQYAWLK